MLQTPRSICLIAGGMNPANRALQPWRYLREVARGLADQGHTVTLLSDGASAVSDLAPPDNVAVKRMSSVSSPRWRPNRELQRAIETLDPQLVLWHLGLTSLLHQRLEWADGRPVIGIFTSPLYQPGELTRLGAGRLARGYRLSGLHLLCSLLPGALFRRRDLESRLQALVVQTETTKRRLQERPVWRRPIQVIPPGVDSAWFSPQDGGAVRRRLGFAGDDIVVAYFGSPAPLRGLTVLLRAFAQARRQEAALKLVVLSRQPAGQISKESRQCQRMLQRLQIENATRWLEACLEPLELTSYAAAADIVALPFELVPSDAPLSLLEARALGKPLVTTRVACLPELAAAGENYLAEPADPLSLAQAILQARAGLRENAVQATGRGDCGGIPRPWQAMHAQWAQFIQAC